MSNRSAQKEILRRKLNCLDELEWVESIYQHPHCLEIESEEDVFLSVELGELGGARASSPLWIKKKIIFRPLILQALREYRSYLEQEVSEHLEE